MASTYDAVVDGVPLAGFALALVLGATACGFNGTDDGEGAADCQQQIG